MSETFLRHCTVAARRFLRAAAFGFLILPGLVAGTGAVFAQDPRFLIESITVEGTRRPSANGIVVSESRLQQGQVYSEQQLREAIYRVKRLPFVLNAEFSLRKGSERGAYELVITVDETRPLFFSTSVDGRFRTSFERRYVEEKVDVNASGDVGFRYFVGSGGLAFGDAVAYGEGNSAVQVGYTQYGVLRPGDSASVSYFKDLSHGVDAQQASADAVIPLGGNHSLQSILSWAQSRSQSGPLERLFTDWQARLGWIYLTTDDPVFPTRGVELSAAAAYRDSSLLFRNSFIVDDLELHEHELDLRVEGRKHWPVTPRQSVSLGLVAQHADVHGGGLSEAGARFFSTSLSTKYSASLWGYDKTRRIGDFRFETGLELTKFEASVPSPGDRALTFISSLVFRNAWGITRFSLSYQESSEVPGGLL